MTNTPSPKHVFMSYSRSDEAVMKRVVKFLRKQGIKVWVDNERLVPGTRAWEEEIEKAIPRSFAIVVLLSPDAKESEWVRREITLADQYHIKIFPALVRGTETNAIFLRLIASQYSDLRGKSEKGGLNSLFAELSSYIEREEQKFAIQATTLQKEREAAEKATREKAAREKAKRDYGKAAKETAEREAAEKAAHEKAELRAARWKAYHPRVLFSKVKHFFDTNLGERTRLFLSSVQSLQITNSGINRAIRTYLIIYIGADFFLESVGAFESIYENTYPSIRGHWVWTVLEIVLGIAAGVLSGFWDADPEEDERLENDKTDSPGWIQLASVVWGCVGFLVSGLLTITFSFLFLAKFNLKDFFGGLWVLSFIPALFYGMFDSANWHNHARYYLKTKFPSQ